MTLAVAMCLSLALTASAQVEAGASAGGNRIKTGSGPLPLSVRQIAVRQFRGWIVETATVRNTGNAPVRSTTGVLGLGRGSGGKATGVLTFSVSSLPPRGSKTLRLAARPIRGLPVWSGTYEVLICTDIYSQIQRFNEITNCSPGPRIAVSTTSHPRPSRRMPNTIIKTRPASVTRTSIAVFRFVSTVGRSTFECSLDGGPWLGCSSPQKYSALVDGPHALDVRAISPSGAADATPAHASWTVDTVAPLLAARSPRLTPATASSTASSYTIGGTISGLSGTVVLQDNGGDDLTINSNGPFTFNTPVASGATYSVTFKSSPSGQTCTTSGATGTVASANVTGVAVTCAASTTTSGQDNFNRADGGLGAGWAAMIDGPLSIVSQQVVGTAGAQAGEIRNGESYGSDQSSQIRLTSTQLSGGEWVGPTVRSQNGGLDTYLGIYYWNNGNPQLRVYKRTAGNWTQLGSSYSCGPLAAGTQLTLSAAGSQISFAENGTALITVTDTSLTGGAPGIMSYGAATAGSWSGGSPPPNNYSIGGTVSGLSGTVVLEDNGLDDLIVSANGSFTFNAPVASGAAYDVTVKNNPGSQICTVSGGAGTVASANVTGVAVTCAVPNVTATDNFNRADGGLGAGWVATSDGGLSIASQQVVGTAGATAGDIRVGESYGSDQSSQIQVTSTQLSGGEWVGPTVRSQNGGLDTYLGIYFWNNGTPQLRVYKRTAGTWTQLGNSYNSGPLAAGTQLTLSAAGSQISFAENGTALITVTDTSLTGGAPGIMSYGAATADNWAGASPTLNLYSVGGTVSGLSGTVVLEDNGLDDLIVSANGPFTFNAPVASGEAYNITVKSNPSGQICSVSGGAGTMASANIINVVVTCAAPNATATDDFNRANGDLGAAWAPMTDGGLVIASDQVLGTAAAQAGDIRVGENYGSDQSSQIQVTSTQLSGGEWVGPTVRSQNGGLDTYLGMYYWNNGTPQLRVYKRTAGTWTQLGNSYNSGPLPVGTQLTLSAAGSQISFAENGTVLVTVADTTLTGGAPGLMTYGAATADNWSGGSPTPSMYSIGGTVSGLSGTVVLEDNGLDDLSISGNGSFTFGAPVSSGETYNVTVTTIPSGQICTVSGGVGAVASANVTSVAVTCAPSTQTITDNFNRAGGGLGAGWAAMSDGPLSIVSQQVAGTAGATAGEIRVGESYGSDQSSQTEVTSTQLTGSEWIGPTVRSQNGGLDTYLGNYYWNNGNPQLQLYKRLAGTWIQLGNSYNCGPLAAGTQLTLSAVGSRITLQVNGVETIAATDTSLTGGAPGVMTNGAATTDNWVGNATSSTPPPTPPSLQIQYSGTDINGVALYNFTSADDGYGPHVLRVLTPTHPAAGVPHNFLYVLPVDSELGTTYGDGLDTLRSLDAQDQYNLTIIEPSFAFAPWYADSSIEPNVQYETFMTKDLVPWVTQNLATTGHEKNWLIGFSRSGLGAADLLLKHPGLFSVAASWDFPADMSSYGQYGSSSGYGTDANFQANYRLTTSFVAAHRTPFLSSNRIWIGGYYYFQTDVADYDSLLTSEGMQHTTEPPQQMAHRWDSGWMPGAMGALSQDSATAP